MRKAAQPSPAPLLLPLALAVLLGGCSPQTSAPTDPKAQPWIEQLANGNPTQREQAIQALAEHGQPAVLAPLLQTAQSDNQTHLRVAALRALAKIAANSPQPPSGLPPAGLLPLLQDPDGQIRAAACDAAGQLKPDGAVEALAGCLRDSQPIVRIAAVHALNRLGPAGVARIDQLLAQGRLEDRISVAEVAGQTADASRVPLLIEALQADADAVRRAAAEALGKIQAPAAIPALVQLMQQPLSAASVAEIQGRTNQPPTRPDRLVIIELLDQVQLAEGRPADGIKAHGWVLTASPEYLRRWMPQVAQRQQRLAEQAVRRVGAEALVAIGGPAQGALVELMAGEQLALAEVVSTVLSRDGQPAEPLYLLLADAQRPPAARLRALDLLLARHRQPAEVVSNEQILDAFAGKSDDPIGLALPYGRTPARVVPLDERTTAILKAGLGDPDLGLRLRFARELALRKEPAALEPLLGLLNQTDPAVLQTVIGALGQYQDGRAVPRLLEILADPKTEAVHPVVLKALAASRDRRATVPLLALARNASALQLEAIQCLAAIADPQAGPGLFEVFEGSRKTAKPAPVRLGLIQAIGVCQYKPAVPVFVQLLEASNNRETTVLMEALGALGDPQAYEAIVRGIGRGRYHSRTHFNEFANAGIKALVQIGDLRALPYLEGLVRQSPDPVTHEYAAAGLGNFRHPEAVKVLLRLLVDPQIDAGIKEAFVAAAVVAQGAAAKAPLVELLVQSPAPATGKDNPGFDPGIYAAQLLPALGVDVVPELRQAVEGAPKHVLARITKAAAAITNDQAVELLALIAKNPDPLVRQWAVVALGRSRQPAAVPALQPLLHDPEAEVVRWTRWALEQHGIKP